MLWLAAFVGTGGVSGYAHRMVAVLAAALASIGTVVLTALFAWARDRTEWKRRSQVRWHDVRRAAYLAFLHAADAVWKEGQTMPYEWKARLDSSEPDSRKEAWTELVRYRGELAACYREIQLVGSEAVVEAARDVTRCVNTIASAVGATVSNPESVDAQARADQAWTDAQVATEKFKNQARAELGIVLPVRRGRFWRKMADA